MRRSDRKQYTYFFL